MVKIGGDSLDKPLNRGFVCSKHHIGYIGGCPSCASEADEQPYSNKDDEKAAAVVEEERVNKDGSR